MKRICLLLSLTAISCGPGHTGQPSQDVQVSQQPAAQPISPSSTVQTTAVGNFKLSLAGCRLIYEGAGKTGRVDFDFPGPCQFSRDRKGDIRVVPTGKTLTLLAESSGPADPSTRLSTRDCATFIRGITVTPREIRLSVQTQKVAQCLPAEWDEKMFHAFAARTQPTTTSSDQ